MDGWTVCVEHQGRHGMLQGSCVAVGREVPRPYSWSFTRCECGAEVTHRRNNKTGRVAILEPGTDDQHQHAPPVRVSLDEDAMAAAFGRAILATRPERRQEQRPQQAQPVAPSGPPAAPRSTVGMEP